jgi:hypothetical protein
MFLYVRIFGCAVDESKIVDGPTALAFPIPVEITPFCHEHTMRTVAAPAFSSWKMQARSEDRDRPATIRLMVMKSQSPTMEITLWTYTSREPIADPTPTVAAELEGRVGSGRPRTILRDDHSCHHCGRRRVCCAVKRNHQICLSI